MPDWVTHLGTTYLASQAALKVSSQPALQLEMRHLLLGVLLPDLTRFVIILVDILDWPAIPTFTYFIPFHSLLITSLLAAAIALLMPAAGGNSRRAFGFIMVGALLHFLMDDLDGLIGCGSTTFYPFYFGKPVAGWNSEGHFASLLLIGSAMALGAALTQRQRWPRLTVRFTRRRWVGASVCLIVALLLPLAFQTRLIERNAYFLGFVSNPSAFEGQLVELCFSEVIDTEPLTVEEFDLPFMLQTSQTINKNEWVSVRGLYRNGAIQPLLLIHHRGFADLVLSLAAGVVFLGLMFDHRDLEHLKKMIKRLRYIN